MTGVHWRHYDRADQGGSTEARPEQKMGRLHRWPNWQNSYVYIREHPSSALCQVLKRQMAKKRRQRDKTVR